MKKFFFIITFFATLSACTSISSYEAKIQELRDSVSLLSQKIEMYQTDPAKIAADIEQLYKNQDAEELEVIYEKLKQYHPEALETTKTKQYIDKIYADRNAKAIAEQKAKERAIQKAREEKLQAVKSLRREYDEIEDITWSYNHYFKHYNNSNHVSLYIGQHGKNGYPWLRLRISYEGDDWIFFDKILLYCDGSTFEVPFDKYKNKKSDNAGGTVWEWIDVPVDNELLSNLEMLAKGKSVKIKLSGKYSNTRVISTTEQKALLEVMNAFAALKETNI